MGRLPGRGCITCKRRKVKCDETKPTCERCKRAYMICEGYVDSSRIIVYSSESLDPDKAKSRHLTSTSRKNVDQAMAKSEHPAAIPSSDVTAIDFGREICEYGPERSPNMSLAKILGPGASRENLLISFAITNVFPGVGMSPSNRSWLLDILEKDESKAALPAICSVSAALLVNHSSGLSKDNLVIAASYYGIALRRFAESLQHGQRWCDPSNMGTVLIMLLYELVASRDARGWIEHISGIMKLIQTCGSEACLYDPARTYLKMSRPAIVGFSIVSRKSCFLAQEEWQAATIHGPSDPDWSRCSLLDIYAKVPGLLEQSDFLTASLFRSGAVDPVIRALLEEQIIAILTELFRWRIEFEIRFPDCAVAAAVDPGSSLTLDDCGIPLFPSILIFRSLRESTQMLFYNTSLLIILQIAELWNITHASCHAYERLSSELQRCLEALAAPQHARFEPDTYGGNPPLLPHRAIILQDIATELCRSVEYHLLDDRGYAGTVALILPLRALGNAVVDVRVRAWLVRTSREIVLKSGFLCAYRLTGSTKFIGG